MLETRFQSPFSFGEKVLTKSKNALTNSGKSQGEFSVCLDVFACTPTYLHIDVCFNPSPYSPCLFFCHKLCLYLLCHPERSEGSREHKEEWMLRRSFLPTVVWMTIGSMVNRVKGLGINFRVYMYTNGMI